MTTPTSDEFPALVPGTVLGNRYKIEALVGRGAAGVVFRCSHIALQGRVVACKVIWPHLSAKPAIVERFRREVTCALDVHHPNVLRAYDFFSEGALVGYAMEYISGGDLAALIRARAPLPLPEVQGLLLQLASGLAAIHAKGILHRDLKPENVLIDETGTPKIGDFGIARLEGRESLTPRGDVVGSIAYLAPELLAGEPPSESSDLYALGAIGCSLITGHPPFAGLSIGEILASEDLGEARVAATFSKLPDAPVVTLVRQLLSTRTADRPSSAHIVAAALGGMRAVDGKGGQATTNSVRVVALSALLIVLCVVWGVFELKDILNPELRFQEVERMIEREQYQQVTPAVSPSPVATPLVVITPSLPEAPTGGPRLTTLRLVGAPKGIWEYGTGITLRRVSVELRNVGSVVAEQVVVYVQVPGGKEIVLQGPSALPPNKVGSYHAEVGVAVQSSEILRARVACANCRTSR